MANHQTQPTPNPWAKIDRILAEHLQLKALNSDLVAFVERQVSWLEHLHATLVCPQSVLWGIEQGMRGGRELLEQVREIMPQPVVIDTSLTREEKGALNHA